MQFYTKCAVLYEMCILYEICSPIRNVHSIRNMQFYTKCAVLYEICSSIRNVQFYTKCASICAALKTILCSCKIRIFRIIFVQKINEWNGIHSDLRKYTNNVSRQPGKGKESLIAIPPITRLFLQFLIVQGIWSFPTLSLP